MAFQKSWCWLVLSLVLLLFSCNPGNSWETTEQTKEETGKNLYTLHCSSCHGSDGKLGGSGAKNLAESKLAVNEIKWLLKNGKNNMPSFSNILNSKNKVDRVSSYILTLRQK